MPCPAGTYGADSDRLTCDICTAGYICLGSTTTPHPTNISSDNGYSCPPGYWCPRGALEPIPCPPGSYRSSNGAANETDCLPCSTGYYQDSFGQDSCLTCSSSSTSDPGSAQCICIGKNRAFQSNDKQCICLSGYEYVDSTMTVSSDTDGIYDCQPIVYSICTSSQVRNSVGRCVDPEDYCVSVCGDAGGTLSTATGTCLCYNTSTLNEVCDSSCRASAPYLECGSNGIPVVYDPTSGSFDPVVVGAGSDSSGSLDCSTQGSKILSLSSSSGTFAGIFGVPTSFSVNGTSSRRLTTAPELSNPLVCIQIGDSMVRISKQRIIFNFE
jgi:hypothetical protein